MYYLPLIASVLSLAILGATDSVLGQNYPTKPVRIIATGGGVSHMVSRLIGPGLSETLRQPVVVEGVKDSYTLYGRVATFTAFPTVLGWPYHEWLWRGSINTSMSPRTAVERKTGQPDTVDQRRKDVQALYETENSEEAGRIVAKYGIEYIYVGKLEREQYPNLKEEKFSLIPSS